MTTKFQQNANIAKPRYLPKDEDGYTVFDIGEGDGYAIENSQNTGLDEHGSASPFSLIVAEKAQKCQAKSAYSFAVSSFLG